MPTTMLLPNSCMRSRWWLLRVESAAGGAPETSRGSLRGASRPPSFPQRSAAPCQEDHFSSSGAKQSQPAGRGRAPSLPISPSGPDGQQQLRLRPGRPRLSKLIVVEGHNDRIAVQRAVNAEVYVMGGATRASNRALEDLQRLREQHGGLVLLLDSDVAGRQARNQLEAALPGCLHAFVPAPLATSADATGWHVAGNVGVEHAPPEAIIEALRRVRPGDAQRAEFTRDDLIQLGLVAPNHLSKGGNFAARRAVVCSYLGIGNCDGKQLLRQLNMYGFTWEDLRNAMEWAKPQLLAQQQQQQQQTAETPA